MLVRFRMATSKRVFVSVTDNELFQLSLTFSSDIADVSNFVHPETPMDSEASSRGTTVYLVDKRIDMLPALLGTNLCSLRPHVERLAFSVIWVCALSLRASHDSITSSSNRNSLPVPRSLMSGLQSRLSLPRKLSHIKRPNYETMIRELNHVYRGLHLTCSYSQESE